MEIPAAALRKLTTKKIKRIGETRFLSLYLSIKRILSIKIYLLQVLHCDSGSESKIILGILSSQEFIEILSFLDEMMTPIAILLRFLDSSLPVMGFIYSFYKEMRSCINDVIDKYSNKKINE